MSYSAARKVVSVESANTGPSGAPPAPVALSTRLMGSVVERSEDHRRPVWPGIVVGLTGGFGVSAIVRWFMQGSRGWLLLGAYLLVLALVMLIGSRGRYEHSRR